MFYWYNNETPASDVHSRNSKPSKAASVIRQIEFPPYDEMPVPRPRSYPSIRSVQPYPNIHRRPPPDECLSLCNRNCCMMVLLGLLVMGIVAAALAFGLMSKNCVQTPDCPSGYEMNKLSTACIDIDECLSSSDGCSQNCTNIEGSFACSCGDEFVLDADGVTCNDVVCPSFICPIGYDLHENCAECVDIDECIYTDVSDVCTHNCTNTDGSFTCSCLDGFVLDVDGFTCNVFACSAFNCQPGFELHENCAECVDIDECNSTAGCNQICINYPGSFRCACNIGFTLNESDNVSCLAQPEVGDYLGPLCALPKYVPEDFIAHPASGFDVSIFQSFENIQCEDCMTLCLAENVDPCEGFQCISDNPTTCVLVRKSAPNVCLTLTADPLKYTMVRHQCVN